MISSLTTEPNPNQALIHSAFRYLVYSHSQLSYVSALGSHREQVQDTQVLNLMRWCKDTLFSALLQQQPLAEDQVQTKLEEIQQISAQDNLSEDVLLVLKQISLLLETLPELLKLRTALFIQEIK